MNLASSLRRIGPKPWCGGVSVMWPPASEK
jgi:hypothetical protein